MIKRQRYFPDDHLKAEVTTFLRQYIKGGMVGQSNVFSPNDKVCAFLTRFVVSKV